MARPRSLKPSYCLDKTTGRAYVVIDGDRTYLGRHGTQDSRHYYDRLIGEWIARGRLRAAEPAAAAPADDPRTVSVVIAEFWRHVETYHAGEPAKAERDNYKIALAHVRRLYGPTPADAFGPLALRAVRDAMIETGWARSYVNAQVGRVRRMFK